MGYDLHITRQDNFFDENGPGISPDEWLALIAADPELSLDPQNGPYFAIWSGPSEHQEPWIDLDGSNLYSKNPDEPLIKKMVQIGHALGAKVQGDDGEFYPLTEQQPEQPVSPISVQPTSWLKRLLGK